ncbi:MAG: sterol desaturase family protein [Gammaproteobacteria bacterium]|nr:sterol desaturase family protein [Gammaproteobacteria bacterium]
MDIILQSFTELLQYPANANKRIFFVYLVASIPLAIIAYFQFNRSFNLNKFSRYLFNKKIWLAPSARQDYAILVINKLIKNILLLPIIITMAPIAIGFSGLLEQVFGTMEFLAVSPLTVSIIFTVILFVFDDFSRFLLHYLLHKIPALWEFHKVHHSAKVLTPMTIYRSHPVETLLYAFRMAITQGIAVGLSYYLFGPTLQMIDILGANIFVFVFNFMGSNLRHSHVWLSWGKVVEQWLISPAMHQIHHSNTPAHFDRNMGAALAIWDRLFGCYLPANKVDDPTTIKFGISRKNTEHLTLLEIYFMPFKLSMQALLQKRFIQKLGNKKIK